MGQGLLKELHVKRHYHQRQSDKEGRRSDHPDRDRRPEGRGTDCRRECEVLALRVAVKPGGCSGFNYDMFFDSEFADDDVLRDFAGVKVVVDPQSAELLTGSTLDYSDSLQGAGFHITNPNATRTCGCGNSFS